MSSPDENDNDWRLRIKNWTTTAAPSGRSSTAGEEEDSAAASARQQRRNGGGVSLVGSSASSIRARESQETIRRLESDLKNCADMLKCAICQDRLVEPRQLPCGHSFCTGCLRTYSASVRGGSFGCPYSCLRGWVTVPVDQLPINYTVHGLISEIPHAEQKQQQRWTAPSNNGQHRTATTYGTFCVIVQDMVGAKQTIEGVKQTTSVAEFTHLVSLKTGIQEEHIKLNYLNKLLRDPYDISHYGIKPDDTVFLLRRFTSGNGYGSENGGPRALQNLGNTCYMNSAIQCLANVSGLTAFMLDQRQLHLFLTASFDREQQKQQPLLFPIFANLILELKKCNAWMAIAPRPLHETIGLLEPQFHGHQQQDSNELFDFMLDRLHNELSCFTPIAVVEGGPPRSTSIIAHLFHGEIMRVVKCMRCLDELPANVQGFRTLHLPLSPSSSTRGNAVGGIDGQKLQLVPLEECLDLLTRPYSLGMDNLIACPTCRRGTFGVARFPVARLPPILCLAIDNSEFGTTKKRSNVRVSFPLRRLDMRPFTEINGSSTNNDAELTPERPSFCYRLISVVAHLGTRITSGHSVAYCLRPTANHGDGGEGGQWYKCDDSAVFPVPEAMVANEEGARLLVYERETNDVTGGGAQQQQQQTLTKDAFCCSLI